MALTVLIVSVAPAGSVAAFKGEAAKHAQIMAITAMNLFRIIFGLNGFDLSCTKTKVVLNYKGLIPGRQDNLPLFSLDYPLLINFRYFVSIPRARVDSFS